jgi:hypothetical protein
MQNEITAINMPTCRQEDELGGRKTKAERRPVDHHHD